MAGTLIRGEPFPFSFNSLQRAPRKSHVVYAFWSKSKCSHIYIGRTDRTLQERLREHRIDCHNDILRAWIWYSPDDLIVCYVSCSSTLTAKLERRLIRKLEPSANISQSS